MCWPEEAATDSVSWLLSFVDGDWIGKSFYKTPKSDRSTSPQSPDSISHVNIKCYVLYQAVLVNLTSFTNKKAIYFVILIIAFLTITEGNLPYLARSQESVSRHLVSYAVTSKRLETLLASPHGHLEVPLHLQHLQALIPS